MLTKSQKRNLRRDMKKQSKGVTTTASVENRSLLLYSTGGASSPYSETNPSGFRGVEPRKPGEEVKILMKKDILITEDSYFTKMLRLPKDLRHVANLLIQKGRQTEAMDIINKNQHLPPAEDTKEIINLMIGRTITYTLDNE
jgi:hypothetical protein